MMLIRYMGVIPCLSLISELYGRMGLKHPVSHWEIYPPPILLKMSQVITP